MIYLTTPELARDLARVEIALRWIDSLPVGTRIGGGHDAYVALIVQRDDIKHELSKRGAK